MDIHQFSPTLSNDFESRISDPSPPPSYSQSPRSPLVLAEMRTTQTEVVTTATETITHLFSFPHWTRKRNGPQAVTSQRHSAEDRSFPELHIPKSSPSAVLFDKALPPTPPNETRDPNYAANVTPDLPRSAAFPSSTSQSLSILARSRKHSTGPQSTTALAHAALGIGLPHASTSFSREANTSAYASSSSLPPTVEPSFSVRRVKSSQRVLVQTRHASENHENVDKGDHFIERRRRGLSFSAASFLNIVNVDVKGKGKETTESMVPSHPSPKPLARKSSFWSKKKISQSNEIASSSNPVSDGTTLILPALPPVHHSSPFEISEFSISSPPTEPIDLRHAQAISKSYSENCDIHSSHLLHLEGSEASTFFPWPSQAEPLSSSKPSESKLVGDSLPQGRPRSQTNTPLLHRLSMGVFSLGESSPAPSIHSNTQHPSPYPPTPKQESSVPKPLGDESPGAYVLRLKSAVNKAEVAGILASSSDSFYTEALRVYINQFQFLDIPIDVALRKLLMEVGLPRETQQIDRVMEAFASRYMQCNPNIFISEDHPYILAFSLIMLHTDAFNPSNKRKMTKADYIKNTKLPGITVEVLECLFDNIVFAPFIYIEDPVDLKGQSTSATDITQSITVSSPTSALPSNGPGSFKMSNRVDPYYLIINNLLEPLRVNASSFVPVENPYTYEGTEGPWDEEELHRSFVQATTIEIKVPPVQRTGSIFGLNTIGTPGPLIDSESSPPTRLKTETWSLKITKIGLLNRKDDLLEGAKKSSNRKWRTWSVILTGSQILLFRDPSWVAALSQPIDAACDKQIPLPANVFRPDESFSVKDVIAVYDRSYTKYNHALRFALPDGRQTLFQARDDADLNEWISRINYASAFKTAGVRMRPSGLSGEDVLLTGVAAATSHLHDMQSRPGNHRPRSWDMNIAHELMDMLTAPSTEKPPLKRRITMSGRAEFELDAPVAPEVEGAEQFKATFDQVKADLASSSWSTDDDSWLSQTEDEDEKMCISSSKSAISLHSSDIALPSRFQIIQARINDLDSKMHVSQSQLDSDMRYIRNIAILTPFQKSTRLRLSAAIQGVAKRISLTRLDIEKLKCHRNVLCRDLASEGRTWSRSKQVALRAAKETLQSRRGRPVPAMKLSLPDDRVHATPEHFFPSTDTPSSHRHGSSASDSFHSAKDFGIDWPSTEDLKLSNTKTDSPRKSQTTMSSATSSSPKVSDDIPRRPALSSSTSERPPSHPDTVSSCDDQVDEQHYDDEQAEEWNQTRCAQRVSLIHVPSSFVLSTKLRNAVDRS